MDFMMIFPCMYIIHFTLTNPLPLPNYTPPSCACVCVDAGKVHTVL